MNHQKIIDMHFVQAPFFWNVEVPEHQFHTAVHLMKSGQFKELDAFADRLNLDIKKAYQIAVEDKSPWGIISPCLFNELVLCDKTGNKKKEQQVLDWREFEVQKSPTDKASFELAFSHFIQTSEDIRSPLRATWFDFCVKKGFALGREKGGLAFSAARSGRKDLLKLYIDHGLDIHMMITKSSEEGGGEYKTNLLLECLIKERAFSMSDKMSSAQMLLDKGASLWEVSAPLACCPLELLLSEKIPELYFSRAYLDEVNWKPSDLVNLSDAACVSYIEQNTVSLDPLETLGIKMQQWRAQIAAQKESAVLSEHIENTQNPTSILGKKGSGLPKGRGAL